MSEAMNSDTIIDTERSPQKSLLIVSPSDKVMFIEMSIILIK